jgi:glucose-1-phosphate thymidylyltransferase
MKAIIPVAGMGTRLRPHTHTQPKVLLNVAGKPIIAHIMDQLPGTRIDHVVFIVGYLRELFENWARERYRDLYLEFVEQPQMLGLGHAVGLGLEHHDEEVMIILGDTIFDVNLQEIQKSPHSSIGVQEVDDPRRFGVVVEKGGFITDLVEKSENPPSNLAIVGLYYIKNGGFLKECIDGIIADQIKTKGEYQITDALKRMVQQGEKMTTFRISGWYDCGTAETLLESNRHLLKKNSRITSDLSALRRTNIIREPVFIAENAEVEHSVIGPYATVGDHARITSSVIRDSIIGDHARVDQAVLEGSIIGQYAVVEEAAKKLNISDHSEINFH